MPDGEGPEQEPGGYDAGEGQDQQVRRQQFGRSRRTGRRGAGTDEDGADGEPAYQWRISGVSMGVSMESD